ncbi:MAG: dipeptide ABC transporter ATP-binding protein [Gammaproteobacteria bacterium]|nr:MAG: dipeptide ABC transporter ATP-binding protein [Gammaproteobacteria bacterium]
MNEIILNVENLRTWFDTEQGTVRAVDGVDFCIRRGETFALLGESGCGKSITALSLLQLVPKPAGRIVSGKVLLGGQDLLSLSEVQMRDIRGSKVSMIFQEPQTSLNPVICVGEQIRETLSQHQVLDNAAARRRVIELFDAVGISDPEHRYHEYPHQMSGGMKQRVMIAIALAGEPELLIADEPTTAVDVTIQAQVLDLMRKLQKDTGMAIMMITHDLGVVSEMVDHIAVMYAGQIVEQADRDSFFSDPKHPYAIKLFASLPGASKRDQSLAIIKGTVPPLNTEFTGCRFADRCDLAWQACHDSSPRWITLENGNGVRCHLYDSDLSNSGIVQSGQAATTTAPAPMTRTSNGMGEASILEVTDLKIYFPVHKGLFRRVVGHVKAVDGVSFSIRAGHTVALVGESGCGKTTAGKGILQLIRPTSGSVRYNGTELTQVSQRNMRPYRADLQIIFQDPFSSMNPRMMVGDIIAEGMMALAVGNPANRIEDVEKLLVQVGLRAEHRLRYPHEFSGGQRQRICIARSLAVEPRLIVCDEPTSALDVSVQAQILNQLQELQAEIGLSYLFITHNMSVVEYLAHDVAVMYLGRIVEQGSVQEIMESPKHPYTRALLSAVPVIDKASKREIIRLQGDMPSPMKPPSGCHFHPRCPEALPRCAESYPGETSISNSHAVRCHLYQQ